MAAVVLGDVAVPVEGTGEQRLPLHAAPAKRAHPTGSPPSGSSALMAGEWPAGAVTPGTCPRSPYRGLGLSPAPGPLSATTTHHSPMCPSHNPPLHCRSAAIIAFVVLYSLTVFCPTAVRDELPIPQGLSLDTMAAISDLSLGWHSPFLPWMFQPDASPTPYRKH